MAKTPEEKAAEKAAADKIAADKAAEAKAAAEKAALEAGNGFPADTPLDQMTGDQREAYWKHQARKHEKTVKDRADYDDLKTKAAELEELRTANASEEEKARDEARREGEVIGAEKYLKEAVTARFQALTGKTDEEVETIFEHADAQSFTGSDGAIDKEKLEKYAETFGKKEEAGNGDAVAAALARSRQAAGGGGATSIADKRKETRESLTPTTKA